MREVGGADGERGSGEGMREEARRVDGDRG